MPDTLTTAADVREARAQSRIAEANAATAYFRLAERTIGQEGAAFGVSSFGASASYEGAVPTRLDNVWPRGDRYAGEVRDQMADDLPSLRDRASFLEEDNWLACGVLDRSVENVIGVTIRIEPRIPDAVVAKRIRKWWKKWSNTTACDVRGEHTFGAILRLFFRTVLRDGDCGLLLTYTVDAEGNRQPKLQVIEPHRIESPYNAQFGVLPNGNQIMDGVELDAVGKPVAYWVRYTKVNRAADWRRVPARDFIFMRRSTRYSNVRGVTVFKGGFRLFEHIAGYLESVVVAARVGASQAMIRRSKSPAQQLARLKQVTVADGRGGSVTQRQQPIVPGTINEMSGDDELTAFNPSQPQQQFPAALDAFCRILGTKFGLTLEQVLLNFSQTSYSSGKMAQNQAKTTAGIWQEDIAAGVVTRVYQWALSIAMESRAVEMPASVEEPWAHEWIPPAKPSPEPLKDMQARKVALELNLETESNLAMEDGYDFDELTEQRVVDRKKLVEAGLYVPPPNAPGISVGEDGKLVVSPGGTSNAVDAGTGVAEALIAEMNAYGVGVRAGAITPQSADEENFRKEIGLPPMSPEAIRAWEADKGTRRPITITPPAGNASTSEPATASPGQDVSEEQGDAQDNENDPQDESQA